MISADKLNIKNYAKDKSNATFRFEKWKDADPFPEILPALLNSADIADYVFETGMIYPFENSRLKSCAYEMNVGDIALWWEDGEKKYKTGLKNGDVIVLRPNSITYITTQENFLIPNYIALRFNFVIKHVHRGLLLGTGPLVNPGFQGRLMIPIHNLTPNTYNLPVGSPVISVEFTKISANKLWDSSYARQTDSDYVLNPMKANLSFESFIEKALGADASSVQSSIGSKIYDITKRFEEQAEAVSKTIKRFEIKGAIGTVIAMIALFLTLYQIYQSTISLVTDANKYVADAAMANKDITSNKERLILIDEKLSTANEKLQQENLELNKRVALLEDRLAFYINATHQSMINAETINERPHNGSLSLNAKNQTSEDLLAKPSE